MILTLGSQPKLGQDKKGNGAKTSQGNKED